ncbi:spore coat protein CotJB [Clostridium cochlearium]|uniref:Spore coat protein JB n=1 Tax=Clostridium cochlearium TaxID=1494 RepID=A0ABY0QI35_CLOCO|nr:spore coat protein CotJB [Clostridium cochlearium]MBV1821237.1 spore coat protein CotJB [Bacteroidales bacterium MSK.15.36]NSJ92438.1 spore coat protein CotJB [Coprococcus sp. MSK.21.13]MCG4571220.1 spore coat protein CotJB [Clostridium cochlearium]MCG4578749.1 spore coat protein CotJB [Clostridium cochlearium]MCR1971337.1 spore coat protein CotJB [Clostridium cochlearium]
MDYSCQHNNSNRSELLKRIQEYEFAAVELNLYLDNNPNNQKAIYDYNCICENLLRLKKIYEQKFGPLTNFGYGKSNCPWQWVEEPWPWE